MALGGFLLRLVFTGEGGVYSGIALVSPLFSWIEQGLSRLG